MTCINNLLSGKAKKQGSHRVERKGNMTEYIYYSTAICTVNETTKTFITSNGGYGTQSTTRAINCYKKELTYKGYTEVKTFEVEKIESQQMAAK
jgi:hypothetical protein